MKMMKDGGGEGLEGFDLEGMAGKGRKRR
jgi:hypothetical protein